MSRWFIEQDTNLSALEAYLDGEGGGGDKQILKAVIYNDVGGRPGDRMAVSEELTIIADADGPADWFELKFRSPVQLEQGGAYWFALHAGPTHRVARFYWTLQENALWIVDDLYSGGAARTVDERRQKPGDDPDRRMCWRIVPQ